MSWSVIHLWLLTYFCCGVQDGVVVSISRLCGVGGDTGAVVVGRGGVGVASVVLTGGRCPSR